jgi:hypothetical protein
LDETLQRPFLSGFNQFIDQTVTTDKTGPKFIPTGLHSQSGSYMGLAGTLRPEK